MDQWVLYGGLGGVALAVLAAFAGGGRALPHAEKVVRLFLSRRFLRFAAVGASGTGVQYVILWAGVEFLSAPASVASAVGYLAGSVVNYLLNYFFTFESGKSHVEAATKYYTVLGIGWCINFGLMALLAHQLGWNYWLAQLFTTGVGLVWNYLGSTWWAFKPAAN